MANENVSVATGILSLADYNRVGVELSPFLMDPNAVSSNAFKDSLTRFVATPRLILSSPNAILARIAAIDDLYPYPVNQSQSIAAGGSVVFTTADAGTCPFAISAFRLSPSVDSDSQELNGIITITHSILMPTGAAIAAQSVVSTLDFGLNNLQSIGGAPSFYFLPNIPMLDIKGLTTAVPVLTNSGSNIYMPAIFDGGIGLDGVPALTGLAKRPFVTNSVTIAFASSNALSGLTIQPVSRYSSDGDNFAVTLASMNLATL